MAAKFGYIFWGLLLVILDLKFNRFDALPDFVGHILVALGCRGLTGISPHFSRASKLSWALAVLRFLSLVLPDNATHGLGYALLTLDCLTIWFLLGGIMDLAVARQRLDLAKRASVRRVGYIVLIGLVQVMGFFLPRSRETELFFTGAIVCMLFLMFLILLVVRQARHELT